MPTAVAAATRASARTAGAVGLAIMLLLTAAAALAAPSAPGGFPEPARTSAGARAAHEPSPEPGPASTPSFPPPDWRPLNTTGVSPPAQGGSLAYLRGAGAVVWVGGSSGGTVETWEFVAGNWTNLTSAVTGAPPAIAGGALAAVPSAAEVAWTSPYAGAATMGLWTFVNRTWTNDSSASPAPPSRVDAAWATDPANGTVVLFGGSENGIYRNDTWTFGAGGWTAIAAAPAPSARSLAGMAAPESGAALVLTGGHGYNGELNDTWSFNGASWSRQPHAGAPFGVALGANALTPTPGGDLLAFGGTGCASPTGLCNDTFEYVPSLAAWENVSSQGPPSPRAGLALTYDPVAGYVLAFGGSFGPSLASPQSWAIGGPLVDQLVILPSLAQPTSTSYYVSHAAGGYGTYTYTYSGQNVDCISRNVSDFRCPLDNDDNGNYTITSQVTDQMGNLTRASAPFVVLRALGVLENLSASVVDAGQAVNYSMNVTPPSVAVVIHWQDLPPDCPSSNLSAFTCASNVPGFYGVSCNVTDQYGTQSVSTTNQLNIHPDPKLLAWPSVAGGAAPLGVTFASSVVGGTGPFVYNWSFGDGTFGAGGSPTHTYHRNGTFLVNLTVTDAVGFVTTTAAPISVVVAPGLQATIAVSAPSWSAPAHVDLLVTVSGGTAPYTYAWTLGNAATGTKANVTATFAAAGTYSVSVTVEDARGLSTTATTTLTVLTANSTGTTGSGGGTATPSWELAALAGGGLVVGAVIGLFLGRRRTGGPPT